MDSSYDVIIIGSGMGGLGTGLKLQSSNPKLKTIAEGIVFCGDGQIFKLALDELGVEQEFIKIDPVETLYFPDKKIIMHGDAKKYQSELIKHFPDNKDGIVQFFQVIKSIMDEFHSVVKDKLEPSFKELLKIAITCSNMRKYATKSFDNLLNEHITNDQLRDVLAIYSLWLGVQPSKIRALQAAVVFFSPYYEGHYYPKGGMLAFAKNMVDAYSKQGGEIRYRTEVKKIIIENGKAVGVELENGKKLRAKWIVSNSDLRRTTFELVGEKYLPSKYIEFINKIELSITGFIVFLGLDIHLKDTPSHIAYNLKTESYLERIASGKYAPEEVLIRIPDKIDPSLRNEKGTAVVLFTIAPYSLEKNWGVGKDGKRTAKYEEIKEKYTQKLILLAENVIPGLSKHIVIKEAATPLTFERYTLNTGGSWYGVKKGFKRPKQQTPLKNLLLAGGNTQGSGVPSCFFSGIKAGEIILKKLKKK
jgi:phytoene dehydrogenase-like protein